VVDGDPAAGALVAPDWLPADPCVPVELCSVLALTPFVDDAVEADGVVPAGELLVALAAVPPFGAAVPAPFAAA